VKPTNEERWAALMLAERQGDGLAYRALLGELAGVARRLARQALSRAGQGNGEVEDIVQEALLAVHLKRASWNPDLPVSPWLHAVMRHKIIDALRRSGRHVSLPIEDVADVLPAPEPEGSESRDVARLVARLDERPRAIVEAISLKGQTTGEVARGLGMSEGAVRVALHRALKVLARLYREDQR